MKHIVSLLLLVVFGSQTFACTRPDDPNWNQLVSTVDQLSPADAAKARRFTSIDKATKYLISNTGGDSGFIVKVNCTSSTRGTLQTVGFGVRDLAECMHGGEVLGHIADSPGMPYSRTFVECMWLMAEGTANSYRQLAHGGVANDNDIDEEIDCNPVLSGDLRGAPVDEWTGDEVESDDIARTLVESDAPPTWFWAALGITVVVVGGVVVSIVYPPSAPVILPALCVLQNGNGWGCPSHPAYPGGTPQPDTGDMP